MKGDDANPLIVESMVSHPWSSLTFAGERHRIVVRMSRPTERTEPSGLKAVDGADLVVAGAIIAVERSTWLPGAGGLRLVLDLIAIAAPERCDNVSTGSRKQGRRAEVGATEPAPAA